MVVDGCVHLDASYITAMKSLFQELGILASYHLLFITFIKDFGANFVVLGYGWGSVGAEVIKRNLGG